jgi:thiol:disulfide interchange protein DsbD
MDRGWHSYWINPGDAGMATSIEWELPAGFEAGEIQWPHPTKIDVPPLTSYGYLDEVLLPVEITPPDDIVPGSSVTLDGRADWLVCIEICLPAWAELSLALPVQGRAPEADLLWSDVFATTRAAMPAHVEGWEVEVRRTAGGFDVRIAVPEGRDSVLEGAYFFAVDEVAVAPSGAQTLTRDGLQYVLSLVASPYLRGPLERLEGVLLASRGMTWDEAGLARALAVDEPVLAAVSGPALQQGTAGAVSVTLWLALAFALLGGLLLNLMPCVFPILSIKVLGFIDQGGEARAKARAHGLAFGLGVVLSFLALAGVILLLRAGGTRLGWGFQLQSPTFVAVMAALFFVIALNLMGVFEVGTWLAGAAGRIAQPSGYADSFSSGVLATLVATPCTAPFMGTALGFALTQPSAATLLVFAMLGIGMALPYVVLSLAPGLLARLPRPGPWMETLRQLLAFPLIGTVIWLVWVFGLQTGMGGAAQLLVALMLLGFMAWIFGRWPAPLVSGRKRMATRAIALVALAAAVGLVARGTQGEARAGGGLDWEPFSTARVEELRSAGRTVFVDFTAAWCVTCQVNEQVILSSSTIRDAFRARDVATLKADWTRFDPAITDALESFGRSGVPLYVLYPSDQDMAAVVLPTILSKQRVLEVLDSLAERLPPT